MAADANHKLLISFMDLIKNDEHIINKQNKDGDTVLHIAVKNDDDALADALIERGVRQDIVNKEGLAVTKDTEEDKEMIEYRDDEDDTELSENLNKLLMRDDDRHMYNESLDCTSSDETEYLRKSLMEHIGYKHLDKVMKGGTRVAVGRRQLVESR
jgi:hypothetical protein